MKKCPNRTAVFFVARGGSADAGEPGYSGRRIPMNRAARREQIALQRKYIPPEDSVRREERLKNRADWRAFRYSREQGLMHCRGVYC